MSNIQPYKIAVIDVGTNTFHMMVVLFSHKPMFEIIERRRIPVRLGEHGISAGIIDPKAFQRGLDALAEFRQIIDSHDVKEVFAIATSGVRSTENGIEFIEKSYELTGIKIEVISGNREAELIYKGIKNTTQIGSSNNLIIDIGGGSVEFIICNSEKIFWQRSYEIGAQRLMDKFHNDDPIPPEKIELMNKFLRHKLIDLMTALERFAPQNIIGASGAFETFIDIYFKQQLSESGENIFHNIIETKMDKTLVDSIYNLLISSTREERLKIPGMVEFRADMIVVSAILLNFFLSNFSFKSVRATNTALKEGVLFEKFKIFKEQA